MPFLKIASAVDALYASSPCNFTGLPQMHTSSPVSVQQHDTQLDTNLPQFEGDTKLWKNAVERKACS